MAAGGLWTLYTPYNVQRTPELSPKNDKQNDDVWKIEEKKADNTFEHGGSDVLLTSSAYRSSVRCAANQVLTGDHQGACSFAGWSSTVVVRPVERFVLWTTVMRVIGGALPAIEHADTIDRATLIEEPTERADDRTASHHSTRWCSNVHGVLYRGHYQIKP